MRWRVGLVDSCGRHPRAVAAARFASVHGALEQGASVDDPSGHGSRLATLIAGAEPAPELLLAQVFGDDGATSAAAVAAAIDWCVANGAALVHLSLGLRADRAVLREAVARALAAGCLVVAATPARGAPVYPAAYPGVLRGTGDARCAPGELSHLAPATFGGCPAATPDAPAGAPGQGASVGAAQVTRALLGLPGPLDAAAAAAALAARSRYDGPERRGPRPSGVHT